ncbi:MAG TPA: SCO family protein [Verrucomicrobiae bacterium]|nr:SCO family protein [Verrucomicrobiae bacterium]
MLRPFWFLIFALFAFAASAQTNQETYPAKGVIVEITPAEKTVTIKHDAIPGYMQAMSMPFEVKDTNELTGLAPGDQVTFRVIVENKHGWIDQITKTGVKTNTPPTTGPFRLVRDVKPLDEGDLLPDYHFTNQLGQAISTAQFKGQALAITFLFTRCPFPNFCPLMANNFAETQKKLLAMPNAPTNWHLLTISFDPENDTPEVLRSYAQAHGADFAHSTYATGTLMDITAIGQQFGLVFWKEEGSIISHNLRTVVIDRSGRVQKIFTGNTWQPEDLVAEIIKAAKQ